MQTPLQETGAREDLEGRGEGNRPVCSWGRGRAEEFRAAARGTPVTIHWTCTHHSLLGGLLLAAEMVRIRL